MKRFRRIAPLASLLLVLVMVLTLAGACAEKVTESPPTAFTITDDLGNTFSFEKPVGSIISLAPSITEMVFAVGAGDKVVGVTDCCDYPPEATSKPSMGSWWTPNLELVYATHPDVVLTDEHNETSGFSEQLRNLALKVITLDPKTLSDVLDDISKVGKLTGKEAETTQMVADMQGRIDAVTTQTEGLTETEKPKVLYITWHEPLWTAGAGTTTNELIEKAGGKNIFNDVTGNVTVDIEAAVGRDPEVIICVTGHGEAVHDIYEFVAAPGSPFEATSAYINGWIYEIDANLVCRAGPRLVDGLERFAKFIHPEIFG
jgi:iron complex transport system substrate-binding protein